MKKLLVLQLIIIFTFVSACSNNNTDTGSPNPSYNVEDTSNGLPDNNSNTDADSPKLSYNLEDASSSPLELLDIRQFLGGEFYEVSQFLGFTLDDKIVVNAEQYVSSVWFDTGIFVRTNNTVETPQVVVYLGVFFRRAGSERFHYAGIGSTSSRSDVRATFGEPNTINTIPREDHGGLFNYGYRTECGNFVWFNFDFDSEKVISIHYIMDREQHFR